MQEHRAAAAGDARMRVVIDLDNEIVEVIVALEPVAAPGPIQSHRLVVVPARRVFAPGIFWPDGSNGQEGARPGMAIVPPPQLPGPERAFWSPAVAFALVGLNPAASERDWNGLPARGQPAPARIAGGGANPDRGIRPIMRSAHISI